MEMHVGAVETGERAIIIDDLIATGGTLLAAIKLLGKASVLNLNVKIYCTWFPFCFIMAGWQLLRNQWT